MESAGELTLTQHNSARQKVETVHNGTNHKELASTIESPLLSSAAPTPGSSWGPMRPPLGGCGEKSAAKSSRKICPAISSSSLGLVTEDLNRRWYEANTGQVIIDVQQRVFHPALKWMAATLDGRVEGSDAVFESKFMLPWSFSEEAAAAKYMPQLQHNMWVVAARTAVLSIITGGGKWVEILAHADPLYQHLIVTAERKFWRCVENGETAAAVRG